MWKIELFNCCELTDVFLRKAWIRGSFTWSCLIFLVLPSFLRTGLGFEFTPGLISGATQGAIKTLAAIFMRLFGITWW